MENLDEFMTEKKKVKKPYTKRTRKDGTQVVIIETNNLSPADRTEVEMLVNAGYELKRKRDDLNKSKMESYVRNNFDDDELNWWQQQVNTVDNFMRLKKLFKETYIFYPKGIKYKYSDDNKQQRYETAFNAHKEELKNKHNGGDAEGTQTENNAENTQPPQNNEQKNKHHH